MTAPPPPPPHWLETLGERDPSISLALAALVREADPAGRMEFRDLVHAYRKIFLASYRGASETSPPELSGDEVRENLARSVLPRLVTEGWVEDTAAEEWAQVRAKGPWWPESAQDRDRYVALLLDRAAEGLARRQAPGIAVPAHEGSVLEGQGLCKSFKRRRVVDNVSLSVRQGEIVGLLGPNGAGKTTTFYVLTGLIRPDAGRVLIDGEDCTDKPMYRRARQGLGYLAQEPSVFRRLTVEQNIVAILETLTLSRAERAERLETLLDELSIKHLRTSKAYALSGGERRRLEITRALVTDPKFMLLDEPFAGIDPIAVHDIQTIVASLRHRGIGVLITDHNVEQTLDIVDRAYIMFEGRLQAKGTVRDLVFNDQVAQVYLGPTLTTRLRERLEAVA